MNGEMKGSAADSGTERGAKRKTQKTEAGKLDFKKEYKDLYAPAKKPTLIRVPEMTFLMVNGRGNPNDESGEYQHAAGLLYALSYTIKMSPKNGNSPQGYFDYVVPPLEGLWWLGDGSEPDFRQKEKFCWTSMIRQPEFVTEEVFQWAVSQVRQKKPELDSSLARLERLNEGLCVQCMHMGPYDNEPETVERMKAFAENEGLLIDVSDVRRHHEIYLGDPRRVKAENLKTVLRIPVRKK